MEVVKIKGITYFLLSDMNSRLILFRYMPDNTISDVSVVSVQGVPYNIEATSSEWIVATDTHILTYTYDQRSAALTFAHKYQLEPSDNSIIDIQSSISHITVRSSTHTLYTYDRKYTSLSNLLNK